MPIGVMSSSEAPAAVVAFAGPSYPPSMRQGCTGVEWRGPIVAGDLLHLLEAPPRCVVILDGLFDQRPAVRHKEILLLLSRGAHVLGAASMGALRAAELSHFGMVGVGHVYRAYADGRLVGDDEVALLHGPEDFDWRPFTVPLVNVRASLLAAVRTRRVSVLDARAMLSVAAGIFYQRRTRDALVSAWAETGVPASGSDRPTPWSLAEVDIKRLDAVRCVEAALRLAQCTPPARPEPPPTVFTSALAKAMR